MTNAVVTANKQKFVVRSEEFGYPMWAAKDFVGDITDQQDQTAYFQTIEQARKVADAWSNYWGYQWKALVCVS